MTEPLIVVGIGGEPATGKSTLVKHVLRWTEPTAKPFEWGLLEGTIYPTDGLCVLGRYGDDEREGTDTLSMAVADDAEEFLENAAEIQGERPFDTILYEGDRLWSDRFVTHVQGLPDTQFKPFILDAPVETLDTRHELRGDDQDESWLKGRRTKYERWRDLDFTHVLHNEDPHDLEANAEVVARQAGLVPVSR